MPMSDGVELFYRAWISDERSAKAIVLCHRGHEHSGRLLEVAESIAPGGVNVFAWDARGHGRSPGRRGFAPGFAQMARDLEWFVRGLVARRGVRMEDTVLVAHSVGAVVGATWVHDYAPHLRGMVLVTPAFRVKLYIPLAIPALRLLHMARPEAVISSYVKPRMLTRDPDQAASYAADPLISRDISNRILLEMHDTAQRVVEDAGAIRVPTLVLSAGSDWMVAQGPQRAFVERLGSDVRRHIEYPGFNHAILHEVDRARPMAAIRDFVAERFSSPVVDRAELVSRGDPSTRRRHDELSKPLPALHPKRLIYGAMRAGLNTFCRLSRGVRIGWDTGFDSGESLDHVYRNRAQGITPLGRMIDRIYLDSVGWQGIRARREHLVARIADALRDVRAQGRSPHLVDIAAGPGRYDLEALERSADPAATAVLRDRSPTGVEAGRALTRERGLEGRVRNEVGDAFDAASLAKLSPRPDVAVVSGLYELFADNALVRRSLDGLAAAVPQGGWLVYTNQPWHPQLEFIARTLPNREGVPWVMRCRTQAEMDALVESVGFRKVAMDIDRWGIFTVSVARRA